MTQFDLMALHEKASALLAAARQEGADSADTLVSASSALSIALRHGKIEEQEGATEQALGLRVLVGQRQALVSTHDVNPARFRALAARAVAMARAAPEDPYAGLPDAGLQACSFPDLDLHDPTVLSPAQLIEIANEAEAAGLAVPGVAQSGGSGASYQHSAVVLHNTNGFSGAYASSYFSVSMTAIAGEGTGMERDYDYATCRHFADVPPASVLGRQAGERTVARLHPQKLSSGAREIVFDARCAKSLVGHLLQAINGASIARKSSFLRDKLGESLFRSSVQITDTPLLARGLASHPFDAEGVHVANRALVADGVLMTWLLDCATARELRLTSTGHAQRSLKSAPSPASSNVRLQEGPEDASALIAGIKKGILVTDLIGHGENIVTGDYSCGCSGFLIENGRLAGPVSEITIAGHLGNIFAQLVPANDVDARGSIAAPSCYVGEMMVAGL